VTDVCKRTPKNKRHILPTDLRPTRRRVDIVASRKIFYFASAAVAVDSSRVTASSSASWSRTPRFSPPSNFVKAHASTMWFTVCRWSQSQEGDNNICCFINLVLQMMLIGKTANWLLRHSIEICSWLPPFCKQNLLLFIQPRWQLRRTYFLNHYNVLF